MPTVKEIRDFLSDKADDAQFDFIVSSVQWVVNDAIRQTQDGETIEDNTVTEEEIAGVSPSEIVADQEPQTTADVTE